MRHFSQSFVAILAALMALPAAASPPDALVNNTLSRPAELNKTIIIDEDIAEIRGQLWPFILGVVAVDLALQTYYYGVYIPQTRGR